MDSNRNQPTVAIGIQSTYVPPGWKPKPTDKDLNKWYRYIDVKLGNYQPRKVKSA
jgi:hypothetical protein